MSEHLCPFTDGQLMALHVITLCGKNPILAAFLLAHAQLHPTAASAAPTDKEQQ